MTIVLQIYKKFAMKREPSEVLGERLSGVEYQVRPGAYALILNKYENENMVGLIKIEDDLKQEKYYLVGGGIEECDNGNYEEALKREILEETGHVATDEEFIMRMDEYFFSPHMEGYFKKEGYFYHIYLKEKMCNPIETNHSLVWLSPSEAYEKVHHLCAKKLLKDMMDQS